MPGPTPLELARSGTEAAHQTALFAWAALPEQQAKYPELNLLFHIPNGGSRDKREAGQLKAQGVKAGVPDLCLPVPSSKLSKHGLYIEMKVKPNKPSNEQEKWFEDLRAQGYAVFCCYSWAEAAGYILFYLNGVH